MGGVGKLPGDRGDPVEMMRRNIAIYEAFNLGARKSDLARRVGLSSTRVANIIKKMAQIQRAAEKAGKTLSAAPGCLIAISAHGLCNMPDAAFAAKLAELKRAGVL